VKLRVLFTIASIYMGLVGLGLIFFPTAFGTGAVPPDPSVELVSFLRLWGSPLLGIAVMDWIARDLEPSRARDAIIIGNTVGFGVIALIDLWGSLGGGRPITKVFVVVHFLFTLAFIWIGRQNRSSRTA